MFSNVDPRTISKTTPKVCLNMIVKNESRVILRLLESVVNLLDGYCICDTGSTDNTIQLITEFFSSRNIPGKIVEEPFKDFGYNRTYALKAARENMPDMEYLLLMDADMVLTGSVLQSKEHIQKFKESLTSGVYLLAQGSPSFFYKNVRIMRNVDGYSYWGVTHEYVNRPSNSTTTDVDLKTLFINDVGDGGSKSDKFQRDIRLLEKGLEEIPNNDRYTFYLANSYRDAGDYRKAIDTFKKRIAIGGWIEEIWVSYLAIGRCYKTLGDIPNAMYWWLEGYNAFPNRIENLFEMIHIYRNEAKNKMAYALYTIANKMRSLYNTPVSTDHLFFEKDIYDYKLDYELSIIGYYVNYENFDLKKCSMRVLMDAKADNSVHNNVLSNYKFYTDEISKKDVRTLDKIKMAQNVVLLSVGDALEPVFNKTGEYVKSTPSILKRENYLFVNQRYVNYRIDDKGGYVNRDKVRTQNILAIIDISKPIFKKVDEFILDYDKTLDTASSDNYYEGLEDVRLYLKDKTQVGYNSNRGIMPNNMKIENGTIDMLTRKTESQLLKKDSIRGIEKNWVMFPRKESENEEYCIYQWYPLTIGAIEGDQFVTKHTYDTPANFKHVRGSTNGIRIGDEIWFLCHIVSYEDRRYYYHIWVVLDPDTKMLKKFSPMFTFEKEKVEYSLGFVHMEESDTLFIGYSIMDRETKYIEIKKQIVDETFLYPM